MIKILKTFPDLPVAQLIREKLSDHLSADAIKGEMAFYNEEGNKTFERPVMGGRGCSGCTRS